MYNVILKKNVNKLVYLLSVISLLLLSACNNTFVTKIIKSDNGSKTVTAVDGYVKGAIITDGSGQIAKYDGVGGKYIFKNTPTYPIKSTGGKLEDTDLPFDIDMKTNSGLILSPITTFIGDNDALREQLTNQGFGNITTIKGFSVII
jgi:hypothetical protein